MAKLARGITYAENEYITAAKLHALVDTAIAAADGFPGTPDLYDIIFGNFVANVRPFHTASSPSSPAANDLAVGSDGKLEVYSGSAFVDVYKEFIHLINGSAITLTTGTPVVADAASAANCAIWGGPGLCADMLGISMTVCAPSATAQIQLHGPCFVRINSPLSVPGDSRLVLTGAGATMLTRTLTSLSSDVVAMVIQTDNADPTSGKAYAMLVR